MYNHFLRYISVFLLFFFISFCFLSSYNNAYAFVLIDDAVVGTALIVSCLVASGVLVYNNQDQVKALATKIWESSPDSLKTALLLPYKTGQTVFQLSSATWDLLLQQVKNWYNLSFSVPLSVPLGSTFFIDSVLYSYDSHWVSSSYEYFAKSIFVPYTSVVYITRADGGYVRIIFDDSAGDRNGNFVVYDGSGDLISSGRLTYVNRSSVNKLIVWYYKFSDGYISRRLQLVNWDYLSSQYTFYDLDSTISVDSSFYSDKELAYDGTGISFNEDVLNSPSDVLEKTKVASPALDDTSEVALDKYLSQLLGVTADVYQNTYSTTNILTRILSFVQSIAASLTVGLVGDLSSIDFSQVIKNISIAIDKFPFSIPWDLQRVLSVFNVPVQSPEFKIGFPNFKGGVNEYTIDLTWFDNYIGIVRTLEVITFDFLLIFVARRLANPDS